MASIMPPGKEPMRKKECSRPMLLLEDGRAVLLYLDVGPGNPYEDVAEFFQDVVARALRAPLLVIFHGTPGLNKTASGCSRGRFFVNAVRSTRCATSWPTCPAGFKRRSSGSSNRSFSLRAKL
jgi:hypothetical protein